MKQPSTVNPIILTLALLATCIAHGCRREPAATSPATGPDTAATKPPGRTAALSQRVKTLQLWSEKESKFEKFALRGTWPHIAEFRGAVLSTDERLIATISTPGNYSEIALWDARTGVQLKVFGKVESNEGGDFLGLGLSPDSRTLVTGDCMAGTRVWDVKTGRMKTHLPQNAALWLDFDPSGKMFVSCEESLVLRETETAAAVRKIAGAEKNDSSNGPVVFSDDGKTIACADFSEDPDDPCNVRLYDVATGRATGVLSAHLNGIDAIVFSHHDTMIGCLGGVGRTTVCKVWKTGSGKLVKKLRDLPNASDLNFSRDDTHLLLNDGTRVAL